MVVTAGQQRDGWDVLPCYVRGTARSASGVWRWEIRAGGTATLETPAGDTELRACTGCEAVLGRPGGKTRRPEAPPHLPGGRRLVPVVQRRLRRRDAAVVELGQRAVAVVDRRERVLQRRRVGRIVAELLARRRDGLRRCAPRRAFSSCAALTACSSGSRWRWRS